MGRRHRTAAKEIGGPEVRELCKVEATNRLSQPRVRDPFRQHQGEIALHRRKLRKRSERSLPESQQEQGLEIYFRHPHRLPQLEPCAICRLSCPNTASVVALPFRACP